MNAFYKEYIYSINKTKYLIFVLKEIWNSE